MTDGQAVKEEAVVTKAAAHDEAGVVHELNS